MRRRMNLHLALAAAAALLALAFALSTLERWIDRRKPHEGAWTVALFLFSAASVGLWGGAAFGWNGVWFRLFYLFGAIVNVPYLALGTIYLLSPLHVARRVATGVHVFAAFSAGVIVVAPLTARSSPTRCRRAATCSGRCPGSWPRPVRGLRPSSSSAVRCGAPSGSPGDGRPGGWPARTCSSPSGTLILGAGGLLNSVLDEMDGFAVSLVIGITVLFAGFLLTNAPPPRRTMVEAA